MTFSDIETTHLSRFRGFHLCNFTDIPFWDDRNLIYDAEYDKTIQTAVNGHFRKDGSLNTTVQVTEPITSTIPAVSADFPTQRVVERKIGRATFIVSTRFNDNKEKDIVSTIARLIEHDGGESAEKSSD